MLSGLPAGRPLSPVRISAARFEGDGAVGAGILEAWRTQLCFGPSVPWTDLLPCASPLLATEGTGGMRAASCRCQATRHAERTRGGRNEQGLARWSPQHAGPSCENQTRPLVPGWRSHQPQQPRRLARDLETFSPLHPLRWCLGFPGLLLFSLFSLFFSGLPWFFLLQSDTERPWTGL